MFNFLNNMKLNYNRETGWGNTLLQVADFLFECSRQKKVPHLPEAMEGIEGIDISTDPDEEEYKANIFINNVTFNYVHPIMRQFVAQPQHVVELVREHSHGCEVGLHIRRGNYGPDSKSLDDGTPHEDAAWFCDDTALRKFTKIIEDAKARVFVCTDSIQLRDELTHRYPDKVCTSNIKEVIHSRTCDGADKTGMLVDWFLLSQCKKVYATAKSTFGYSAAVYGGAQLEFVL
jgi:hypothetical protein